MTDGAQEGPRTYSIPEYGLLRTIGSGSFGEVWLARNVMQRFRAIKIVCKSKFEDDQPFDQEFQGLEHFEQISLTHPGLVSLLHIGKSTSGDYFYYVMELADDMESGREFDPDRYVPRTLEREIIQQSRISYEDCLSYGVQMAAGLAHLQRHGLTHRDVKPSNIIFVDGALKFADIGLVTKVGETSHDCFTKGYVPPEGPGGLTADIYALGRVLYKMATGFSQDQFPELPKDMLQGNSRRRLMALNEIILNCCAFEPGDRYQDAAELHVDLVRLRQSGPGDEGLPPAKPTTVVSSRMRVYLVGKEDDGSDEGLIEFLANGLQGRDHEVLVNDSSVPPEQWAQRLEQHMQDSDVVVALVTGESVKSEMFAHDLELAESMARSRQGKPKIIPVRVRYTDALPEPLGRILDDRANLFWENPKDNERILDDLVHIMETELIVSPAFTAPKLEAIGGAVPLKSKYYIDRPEDTQFKDAIGRHDGIVLVKGARQVGKTSLLARGLDHARGIGSQVALTDYQKLNNDDLSSVESFYLKLGEILAEKLQLDVFPDEVWESRRGPNMNFERFIRRHVMKQVKGHLVWGMDEVDRLFGCPFSSEIFGLFRSWYNERALDPHGPWSQLTLAIGYATEAHLFITDVNQSPFNVGTRIRLEDFNMDQVRDMNRRYYSPLKSEEELRSFHELLGGQPYMVRLALNELVEGRITFDQILEKADCDEGIFRDHLRRILVLLDQDAELRNVVRQILNAEDVPDANSFYRLRSAGLMVGESPEAVRPRCLVYERYLQKHLK